MEMHDKITSLFQQITQLPEDAQAEVIDRIVAMRCADLGIDPADDVELLHAGD